MRTASCFALAAAALAPGAFAGLVFTQPPDQANAAASTTNQFCAADTFLLEDDVTIDLVRFWGAYGLEGVSLDSFTISFYMDDGGVPAQSPFFSTALVNLERAQTEQTILGAFPEYVYTAELETPVALNSSIIYWVSIENAPLVGTWFWETSSVGDAFSAEREPPALEWSPVPDAANFAFQFICAPSQACDADLTGDGVVGPGDLAFLLGAWGTQCDGGGPTR